MVAGVCYHVISRNNPRLRLFKRPCDLRSFLALMGEAQQRTPLELLAACLMPNHFHLVVRPLDAADIPAWIHWLLTTHSRRVHQLHGTHGRLWQGRFKAFPIEQDRHLLTVLRYVERNALRAGIVGRAEEWVWGSLSWRLGRAPGLKLAASPVALPLDWVSYVNAPQTAEELDCIRACVNRQRPFGGAAWVEHTAQELGLANSLRAPGRPRRDAA